jgi:glycosyltransferase involved in cell wall biosynthesis
MLDLLLPLFEKLFHNYKFKLIIIGGDYYDRKTTFPKEFIKWSLKNEIEDLKKIDIGLMPLTQDNESKGKAGFKLIQYMGLGIVSIASAITINNEIIKDKENSFLAENNNDWFNILKNILDNEIDLTHIGTNARKTILNNFTFNANLNKYLSFIKISINN